MSAIGLAIASSSIAQNIRQVKFQLQPESVTPGATYSVRGNRPPLSWDKSLPMTDPDGDGIFSVQTAIPANNYETLEYKYLKNETWEEIDNRVMLLHRDTSVTDRFNVNQILRPESLPQINPLGLRLDFQLAKKALLELHPGLFRYRTPQETEKFFADMEPLFSASSTYQQAYRHFAELTAFFKCGHTFPSPFNQSALIRKAVFDQPDKLPFTFCWMNEQMVVLRDVSGHKLAPGTQISHINNVPITQLLQGLLALVKADGDNQGKRLSDLQVTGFGKFEMFDILLPLVLPPGPQGYTLHVGASGEPIAFETITREERKHRLAQNYGLAESDFNDAWKFEWLTAQTAYLKLPHFQTWKMKTNWLDFLDRAFDTTRIAAKHLVIDIRNNEGGNDAVIEKLVRFVASKSVALPASEDRVRYQRLPESFLDYTSSWDKTYLDFSGRVRAQADYFTLTRSNTPRKLSAQRKAFQGQVWLLVNEANSSATFYLAHALQQTGLATVVGQPTGGSRQGLNGGQIIFLRLPNSGIEIDIPVIGTFFSDAQSGGVTPDIVVKESLTDKLGNTDGTLEEVVLRIGTKF